MWKGEDPDALTPPQDDIKIYPVEKVPVKKKSTKKKIVEDLAGAPSWALSLIKRIDNLERKIGSPKVKAPVKPPKTRKVKEQKKKASHKRKSKSKESKNDSPRSALKLKRNKAQSRREFLGITDEEALKLRKLLGLSQGDGKKVPKYVYYCYSLNRNALINWIKKGAFTQKRSTEFCRIYDKNISKKSAAREYNALRREYKGIKLIKNPSSKKERELLKKFNLLKKKFSDSKFSWPKVVKKIKSRRRTSPVRRRSRGRYDFYSRPPPGRYYY
jgi:hypothetical protein